MTWIQQLQSIETTTYDACTNKTRALPDISVPDTTLCLLTDYGHRLLLFDFHTSKDLNTIKFSITHDDFLRDSSMGTCGNFEVTTNANSNKSLLMDLRQL